MLRVRSLFSYNALQIAHAAAPVPVAHTRGSRPRRGHRPAALGLRGHAPVQARRGLAAGSRRGAEPRGRARAAAPGGRGRYVRAAGPPAPPARRRALGYPRAAGCTSWRGVRPSTSVRGGVCAGTFVVSAGCGRGAVCRQCPTDTFSSAAGLSGCTLCRKCEGRFKYLRECSSKSDAECTCKEGYRCSGNGCSRCDRSCGVGQENNGSGCQACRYGTFNDQPNGSCKNWTKCFADQVLEPGTAAKDVICKYASANPTLVTTLPTMSSAIPLSITVPGKDLQEDIIRISLTVAGLLCIVFLLPSCICFSIWQKKKLHAVFKKIHTTPEQSIQEDDACSCRFPEEEQGECQDCGKSTEFRDLLVN